MRWIEFDAPDDEAAKTHVADYKGRIIEGYELIECREIEVFTAEPKVAAAAAHARMLSIESELGPYPHEQKRARVPSSSN